MTKHPYTYCVLRYVHDTGTGEFANIGVVLVAPEAAFAEVKLRSTYGRLSKMFPGMDGEHFRAVIRSLEIRFDQLAEQVRDDLELGHKPASAHDVAFSVIVPDDSSFQWSPMGGGLSADPRATLETLYGRVVEKYEERTTGESRSDDVVWKSTFKQAFDNRRILSRLQPKTISVLDDEVVFSHAWQNHKWHCLETVSFDLMQPGSIKDKAHSWLGRMTSIQGSEEAFKVYYLVGEPHLDSSRRAYEQALKVLDKTPGEHQIVHEYEASSFAESMAKLIEEHDADTGAH